MHDHVIPPSRRPIVIADSQLSTGHSSTAVRADDAEALLRDYLRLIRKVRNQQRARNIALRRVDIEALAHHLEWSDDQVLARLADLMGATRRQRATMLAVLATGAALITVASPMSAAASNAEDTALEQTEPPVVIDAEAITNVHVGVGRPLGRVTDDTGEIPRRAPVLDLQADLASFSHTAAEHQFAPSTPAPDEAAEPAAAAPNPAPDVPVASEPATDPDGATVAVGQAPVPPPAVETGVDTDGNTVAVGQAPVPPAADGSAEAEPEPPMRVDIVEAEVVTPDPVVETATDEQAATGVDADGNTVAVGQAPVPPAADGSAEAEPEPPMRVDIVEAEVVTPDPVVETAADEQAATGVDADGNTVAVGEAPVPPSPVETGVDADGNTVAVGEAPVPPAPDA